MGTSASGGGAGGTNPLIPGWIEPGIPPPMPLPPATDGEEQLPAPTANGEELVLSEPVGGLLAAPPDQPVATPQPSQTPTRGNNRFTAPRKAFNQFIRSGGRDATAITKALKGYSRHAAGGTRELARRMQPAASRVVRFHTVVNTFRQEGSLPALRQFQLQSYEGEPLFEVLAALSDVIFENTGKAYEDTQDDSIAKQAFSNTVIRIGAMAGFDADTLTNAQVELMTAIFIEETIAQRVIVDIGNMMTVLETDVTQLITMEEQIYQIISGLVRTRIMPEIVASQLGDQQLLATNIENIYRIAFDALAGTNN